MKTVFAFAFIFALSVLLVANTRKDTGTVRLVTSFDFTDHPPCSSSDVRNCIKGIRFYDADSHLSLAEVGAKANMTGQQPIIGTAKVSSIPSRVYAVTVYLDNNGHLSEGPRGQISEFVHHASR